MTTFDIFLIIIDIFLLINAFFYILYKVKTYRAKYKLEKEGKNSINFEVEELKTQEEDKEEEKNIEEEIKK